MSLRFRGGLGIAREFVEADRYGLAEVHGTVLFARGDTQKPMAVAEVFIGEAALLRAEKKRHTAAREMLSKVTGGLLEAMHRMLQLSKAYGGSSDDQRTIRYGVRDGLELLGFDEQRRGAHGGARLAKTELIGVHHTKMEEAEVAHGAGGSADVEGIARGDKHDLEVFKLR